MLKEGTNNKKWTENEQTNCQRFAILKELQSKAQPDTISTFNFAQPHSSSPTTRIMLKTYRQKFDNVTFTCLFLDVFCQEY